MNSASIKKMNVQLDALMNQYASEENITSTEAYRVCITTALAVMHKNYDSMMIHEWVLNMSIEVAQIIENNKQD